MRKRGLTLSERIGIGCICDLELLVVWSLRLPKGKHILEHRGCLSQDTFPHMELEAIRCLEDYVCGLAVERGSCGDDRIKDETIIGEGGMNYRVRRSGW